MSEASAPTPPREREELIADAVKLDLLAEWFDAYDRVEGWGNGTEVQDDLRRIAAYLPTLAAGGEPSERVVQAVGRALHNGDRCGMEEFDDESGACGCREDAREILRAALRAQEGTQ